MNQIQPVNMLGRVAGAVQTAGAIHDMRNRNALRDVYQEHGQGILAGDPTAMNALAGVDPGRALDFQSTHQQMDYRRQANDRAVQDQQRKIDEYVAGLDAAEAAQQARELETGIAQGIRFYQAGDLDGLNNLLVGYQIAPIGALEEFPAVLAPYGEVLDRLKQVQQFSAGPAPLSAAGKVQADINSGLLPQGTPLRQQADSFNVTTADGTQVQYGPPSGQNTQTTGTPRDAKKLSQELSKGDAATLNEVSEAARTASQLESLANQLETITPQLGYTGPGGAFYGAVDDMVGFLPGDSGARGAFKSLAMEAQLSFTEKTKGAITDREMAMFKAAVPNLGQTPEANRMISQVMQAGAKRVQARAAFFENWARVHGSLEGAQEVWGEYMRDNPLLAEGPGGLTVNPEGDWNSYLNRKPAMSYTPESIMQMGRDEVGMVPIERLTGPQIDALEMRMQQLGL
ncbi:hypothetical protein Q5Y75_07910 [Ruegeria sp. 2205SS24-7]|uniref:hypothetical protein n=1 Tax=Ruegeria discodermiae TaxID=3064389 RepID=UPI002741282F|nr:hypothetical protein [Ruegeria sp. 2205SS24-7]MDP5217138.1 hypothetical protein [Ruegeria sp. 2205SS24-7]